MAQKEKAVATAVNHLVRQGGGRGKCHSEELGDFTVACEFYRRHAIVAFQLESLEPEVRYVVLPAERLHELDPLAFLAHYDFFNGFPEHKGYSVRITSGEIDRAIFLPKILVNTKGG